jgi:hypothetical protein
MAKVGELIGGSQREDRYDVLQQRIEAGGMDVGPYEVGGRARVVSEGCEAVGRGRMVYGWVFAFSRILAPFSAGKIPNCEVQLSSLSHDYCFRSRVVGVPADMSRAFAPHARTGVSRHSQVRQRATLGLWAGLRAFAAVRDWTGQHPRGHPLPALARQRRVLRS